MAKLYFKYGAMGSSKTAQALITKYNYEENDMRVWLMKPGTDTRDGASVVKSRIGLKAEAQIITPDINVYEIYRTEHDGKVDAVIVDDFNVPVMCFGLRTDFQTKLFPGSLRLMEIADTIQEIKTICDCGAKATVNARISDGYIVTEGAQVFLGGNDAYIAMCHKCYIRGIREHRKIKLHGQE